MAVFTCMLHVSSRVCALLFVGIIVLNNSTCLTLGSELGQLFTDFEAQWVKCLSYQKEIYYVTCPLGFRIYRPTLFMGSRANRTRNTCVYSEADCKGFTQSTLAQVAKCYWRRSCNLEWKAGKPLVISSDSRCVGTIPDYVVFNNPICVFHDAIINICDRKVECLDDVIGVIRSHSTYPGIYTNFVPNMSCRKILSTKNNHTLIIYVDEVHLTHSSTLTIDHLSDSKQKIRLWTESIRHDIISVTSGCVIIEYFTGFINKPEDQYGFVIRYEHKHFKHQAEALAVGTKAKAIAAFDTTHFNVKASISKCISDKEEAITLTCAPRDLIFDPQVSVGVTEWNSMCPGELGGCKGAIHTLHIQRLECFWQTQCQMTWQRNLPIVVAEEPRCIARQPNYVEIGGATCVPRNAVIDICDRAVWHINTSRALLISHTTYPWHYSEHHSVCRKRLQVHRKFGLRIVSYKMDLATNTKRDNVKLWSVTQDNVRTLIRAFHGRESIDHSFTSGCVDVEFRKGKNSNKGQGFVFKLETVLPATKESDDFFECGNLVDAVNKERQLREQFKKQAESRKARFASPWSVHIPEP